VVEKGIGGYGEIRGFAIKFYTEMEIGILWVSTPVFVKDGKSLVILFILKRDPH
jgi:catalase